MARYYSRRRRYTRPYSVSFRFNRTKRSFKRQNAGAMQQRDIGRFVIKMNDTGTLSITTVGAVYSLVTYNIRQLIADSTMFQKLKQCFDQVKINAIKVKIVPVGAQAPATAFMQSCIAWDRNGVTADDLTYDKLASYGSAKLNYYSGSGKTTMSHFIAAETISEKSCYLWTENPAGAQPSAWRPTFIFGIKAPANVTEGNTYSLAYAIEWAFDLTFRGTRYQ